MNALGDGPIDAQYIEEMKEIARFIDRTFNPDGLKLTGFCLMVFPFGDSGRCNYMSNADRADIMVLLREQLLRFQGSPDQVGRG